MQQPNIDLRQSSGVVCENCGHNVFQEGIFLRKVSKFISQTTQDALIPLPTFYCAKCNHVNDEFIPKPLKQLDGTV